MSDLKLIDSLLKLVESDEYQDHIDGFMQQHCDKFCRQPGQDGSSDDASKCEQSLEEYEIFSSYCKLIDSLLTDFLEENCITQEELMSAVQEHQVYARKDSTGRRLRALVNSFHYSGFLNTILQYSDAEYDDDDRVLDPAAFGLDPHAHVVEDLLDRVDSLDYQERVEAYMRAHVDKFCRQPGQTGGTGDATKCEQSLEEHEVYEGYVTLVESLLEDFLKEKKLTQGELFEILKDEKVVDAHDMTGARMRGLLASFEYDDFLSMMLEYSDEQYDDAD